MTDLDCKKLLEPYSENGRTVEGQVKWLTKKSIPPDVIGIAIKSVYSEIANGKIFADGHELDRYLLDIASKLY